jgi:hypothetical protein
MKLSSARFLLVTPACATLLAGCGGGGSTDPQLLAAEHQTTINRYCVDCHNHLERVADFSLEGQALADATANPEVWEKVIRKLRAGMMPPPDGPRPTAEQKDALAGWLENELDRFAAATPDPGYKVPMHRLNRVEYQNAVRDLLGVNVDVRELLPGDDASHGFDNIAGVLRISPLLLERYLTAADRISRVAVGLPPPMMHIDYFRVPDDRSQEQRLPGMPFGTRGGTSVRYNFPVDGEYAIAVELQRDLNEGVPLYEEDQLLEVSVDGERVALFTLPGVQPPPDTGAEQPGGGISQITTRLRLSPAERAIRNRIDDDWQVRIPVRAGEREVTATFVASTAALDEAARLPFLRPYPAGVNMPEQRRGAYLRGMEISGPYDLTPENYRAADSVHPPSREQIFVCAPGSVTGPEAADDPEALACARNVLGTLARRAYRRPVFASDVDPLLGFFAEGAHDGGFDAGVQFALKRLLVSPEFLFRVELDPERMAPHTAYKLGDFELASRLSFFLWSSIPDEQLLTAAEAGELRTAEGRARQVQRMLADPRAEALVENFSGQWLYLRNLEAIVPVQSYFPDFDDTLREALRRETELFFASIVREDRSVLDLLQANYTYMNERVAAHYGVNGVKGPHFRRVHWPEGSPRRGLLGHASILSVTSYPDRTSPVIRGEWILKNLLGTPPPAPPPDVPVLVETDGSGVALTMRARLERHRADPNCASCHSLMDPLGFALENFNAIGQWRTIGDAGEPIDAMGGLPDGTEFDGVEGLRQALLSSELFLITMTERLMTYALGRGVEARDMPTVRQVVREASRQDHRFSAFVLGIVESPAFLMRLSAGDSV